MYSIIFIELPIANCVNYYAPYSCDILYFIFNFQVMCIQYWPSAKVNSENYGDLNISVLHEEELANFHIRTIQVVKKQGTVSKIYIV